MAQIIKGKCTDISSEGKGVVKVNNNIYFVDGLFVGEEAELLVQYSRSGVYFAKVKSLLKASPNVLSILFENAVIKFKPNGNKTKRTTTAMTYL